MHMDPVIENVDNFLKYGPMGFSALIFIAVIIALLTQRDKNLDKPLRLITWISFFVFLVSAVLAFIPEYYRSFRPTLTDDQARQIGQAMSQLAIAIQTVQKIPSAVAGSCPGGSSGVSPGNYGHVVKIADDALKQLAGANQELSHLAATPRSSR